MITSFIGRLTTLMAAYNVASGSIIQHQLNPTRTEEDFCQFFSQTCQLLLADPEAEVILLANQLNSKIQSYVCYYNSCLSKPLNWKFKGFSNDKPLAKLNCQSISS